MECPKCTEDSTVTRTVKDLGYVYRVRRCKDCGYVFYTKEILTDMCECMDAINRRYAYLKRCERE